MVRGPGERHGRPPGDHTLGNCRSAGAFLGAGRAGKAAAVAGVDGAAPPRLGCRPAGGHHGQRPRHQDGAGAGRARPAVGLLAGRPDPRGHRGLAGRPGQAHPGGMGRRAGRDARRRARAVRRYPRPHPPGRQLPARPGAAPGRRDRTGGTAGRARDAHPGGVRPAAGHPRPVRGRSPAGDVAGPAPGPSRPTVLPRLVVGGGPADPAADRPGRRRAAPAHPARRRRPGPGRCRVHLPGAPGPRGRAHGSGRRRLGAEYPPVRRGRAPAA